MGITIYPHNPPLAWGYTPLGGGPSPRIPPYYRTKRQFGGDNTLGNAKKIFGKKLSFFGVFIINKFKMRKIIRLTESDLERIVSKVIKEQTKDVLGQIAAGAGSGALVGSVVPGVGNVVGAAVGGLAAAAATIFRGAGNSDVKVKEFMSLCNKSQAPITPQSKKQAQELYNAITGAGTDEQTIYNVFNSFKDVTSFCSTVKTYNQAYNNLFDDLDGDIDIEIEWNNIANPLRRIVVK